MYRALILVLGILALIGALTSAIHAAALPIAIGIVVSLLLGLCWLFDYPSDKDKPP